MRCWFRATIGYCEILWMNARWEVVAKVGHFGVMGWSCGCVSVAENCPRLCNVKAMDQYSCMEYELTGVMFRLMVLVVRNDINPLKKHVRGLLREWRDQDLPLKTVSQCNLVDQFEIYVSAGSKQATQQFYVKARKNNSCRSSSDRRGNVKTNGAKHVDVPVAPNADLSWQSRQFGS